MTSPKAPALAALALLFAAGLPLAGQTASLRGVVTDESGGVVTGAAVTLAGASAPKRTARTNNAGVYQFQNLPPGSYEVTVAAPALALRQPVTLTLEAGARTLDLVLGIAARSDNVTVGDTAGTRVSTDAAANASALVLRGDDLQALADNPTDLAADLQALAGPSAGPNGGAIFIDGFSGGQLPSKESIREIRINQNPFSPEYDRLGFGRIEIFTKPGSDKFKVALYYNFADDALNSRNPYAAVKAPFRLYEYGGSVSGPLGKKASYFLDVRRDSIDNGAIVNATILDPASLDITPFTGVPRIPQRRWSASPRLDWQLSTNHTLVARYSINRAEVRDAGVGSFNLLSRGFRSGNDTQTAQLTETAVLGARAVNETRFQYFRGEVAFDSNSLSPALLVLGSFNGGGAQLGRSLQTQDTYELQNYTTLVRGSHNWRFGVRLRGERVDSLAPLNFGGTFTFGGGAGPLLDANNRPVLDASGAPVIRSLDSIERYRRTLLFQRQGLTPLQIRALGGGATQFTRNAGNPDLAAGQFDFGAFAGDDWRLRTNLTLSLGIRYEAQNNLHDWTNFAPRLGIAWAPRARAGKGAPKNVFRAGFGMFYDRFALLNTINARRFNGLVQLQYVVADPDFFPLTPDASSLPRATQAVRSLSEDLRAPYVLQSAFSWERQLPANTTIAVTYANTRGLHVLRSRDVNAPLPGTYDPARPESGVYPLGRRGPVFDAQSSGIYNQNQMIVNVNSRVRKNVSLFGSYVLNRALSDTDGLNTFPARPYSFDGEYGPAATDIRQRGTFGGSITTKWDIRLNPLLTVDGGPPFDITVGRDLYGTTLFNGRPALAADPNRPGLIRTVYGLLDPNPAPGQATLGRNFGRGPGSVLLNLRIGKTFSFGLGEGHEAPTNIPGGGPQRRADTGIFAPGSGGSSAPAKTSRRYNLTLSMSIRNVLNRNNPGPIFGNITSPLFGRANQAAGGGGAGGFSEAANNRRFEIQTRFTF